MQILDCYNKMAEAFMFNVTDEGMFLTVSPTGSEQPTTIEGKRLVMPTKAFLKKGFGDDYMAFHPLSESISRQATSDVQKRLQKQSKAILSFYLLTIVQKLAALAEDKKQHKNIPAKEAGFLKDLANFDKKTVEAITKILGNATKRNKLVTVYLKSSGVVNGDKMNRVTTIHFPFISELHLNDDKSVMGVKLTKKQRESLITLMNIVVPGGEDHNTYVAGSNSRVAPYFTSFTTAYRVIVEQFNNVIKRFDKYAKFGIKQIPLYTEEDIESYGKIYNQIPPQKGNTGETHDKEDVETVETKPVANVADVPWNLDTGKVTKEPTKQKAVKPTTDTGTVSVNDVLKSFQSPMTQPQFQQPMQMPMQNQMFAQPVQQQPQPGQWMPMGAPTAPVQQFNPFNAAIAPTIPNMPQMQQQTPWNVGQQNMGFGQGNLGIL